MKPEVAPYNENATEDDSEDQGSTKNKAQENEASTNYPKLAMEAAEAKEVPKSNFVCEIKEYEARYNLKGERNIKEAGSKPDVDETPKDGPQYVMKSYKYYTKGGEIENVTVEVHSPHVQEALRTVIKSYPNQNFSGSVIFLSGGTVGESLACLFHYRRELESYGREQKKLEAKMHVFFAVKFVEKELRRAIQRWEIQVTQSENPGIEYGDLWMLFKPKELVFTGTGHSERILEVVRMQYIESEGMFGDPTHLAITAKIFSHDGKTFGYLHTKFKIFPYTGTQAIAKLTVYPLKYHSDESAQRDKQIERGEKFCKLAGVHYRMYKGTAWAVEHERVQGFFGTRDEYPEEAIELDERIIVDCTSFKEYRTGGSITLNTTKKLELNEITESDYILGNYQVAGFSLTEKRWCWFMVDYIDDIQFDENAFDTLLLPAGQRRLVRALARQHALGQDSFDDMIKKKGKGCIFLLHGPPGVGKTATVEGIADNIRRPMYVMMSGDLGSDLKAVETNFNKALKLVTKWKAIILIDEADVFLEKRSSHDLARNSLVSILLRIFEYFGGIMFMTTNRVNSIDPAFQSRIHITLAYNPLDVGLQKELWLLFLKRTADYDEGYWSDQILEEFTKMQMNGRQIKNTVRTANSLALAEGHKLSADDIHVVLETVAEFEKTFKARPSPQPFTIVGGEQVPSIELQSWPLNPPLLGHG